MSEENPWKTLDSKIVYQTPWMTVREDKVIQPNGTSGIYGYLDLKIATGVVALTENSEVYLVGQYRYPTRNYSWEVIEGGTEKGETPLEAAKRELKEEAGLEATDWIQLGGEIHLSNCITSEIGFIFLARDLKVVPASPDATEILKVKKIPYDCARDMTVNGEITDALSIIALYRTAHFR